MTAFPPSGPSPSSPPLQQALQGAPTGEAVPVQSAGMRALPVTEADDNADVEVVEDEVPCASRCDALPVELDNAEGPEVIVDDLSFRSFRFFLAALSGPLDSGCILPCDSALFASPS